MSMVNSDGKAGHLSIFISFEHLYLMMLLKCNFFRASFSHPTKDTDGMQLRLLKVERLLHNAEKD